MATSIASQLEALRSFAKIDSDPLKRPFTRPSILFDPKEAADIDIETIFTIALQGQSSQLASQVYCIIHISFRLCLDKFVMFDIPHRLVVLPEYRM